MHQIVAMGEVVADIYRRSGGSALEMGLAALPGGAPANVAVGAARLGASAAFVGAVGDDLFGDFILSVLGAEGVDTSGVRRAPDSARTSIAFVEIDEKGGREFTFYRSSPAADELLGEEHIPATLFDRASFLTFGSIPLIGATTKNAVMASAALARERGVAIAFDVNLRPHLWGGLDEARRVIEPLYELASVVKLSDDELGPLFGYEDEEAVAAMLFERGVSLLYVTRGERGVAYFTPEFRGEVPSFEVEVVDSTGAGDAFLAAALARLAEGGLSEAAVAGAAERGAAAGALACRGFGAMTALPRLQELEEFMQKAGRKLR